MFEIIPKPHSRIIIAALRGGSGKTVLTLGLAAAWQDQGYHIATFKKGPDFIDASWLGFVSKGPCHNLDPFLMNNDEMLHSFIDHSKGADLSLIEGNRGLFDGLDEEGTCSTSQLAKLLKAPVLLVVEVTMATRTIAAMVKGCQTFDPDLDIVGVVLNRVSGPRQNALITGAIEKYCGIPVVGSVPRLKGNPFPERHMGLVPFQERDHAKEAISWAKSVATENLQLDRILDMAREVNKMPLPSRRLDVETLVREKDLRVGFIRDRSFWFYYPENLSFLEQLGATLVEINAMEDKALPPLDALYIGGGFPEAQAKTLSDNVTFRRSVQFEIEKGLPVYAECGGLMYLGQGLLVNDTTFPMVGALPILFHIDKRPQGHGYTVMEVDQANPFFNVGETLKGHEFHYSKPILVSSAEVRFAFKMRRGNGITGLRDGICRKNVLGTYTHIHAAGNPSWARYFIQAAGLYKKQLLTREYKTAIDKAMDIN